MRTETLLPAPFQSEIVQGLDDVFAGLLFFRRGDSVFAIQEHVVGGAFDGAVDHGWGSNPAQPDTSAGGGFCGGDTA